MGDRDPKGGRDPKKGGRVKISERRPKVGRRVRDPREEKRIKSGVGWGTEK